MQGRTVRPGVEVCCHAWRLRSCLETRDIDTESITPPHTGRPLHDAAVPLLVFAAVLWAVAPFVQSRSTQACQMRIRPREVVRRHHLLEPMGRIIRIDATLTALAHFKAWSGQS